MRNAGPGDVLIFDMDQPYAMSIPHQVTMRSVLIHRSLLQRDDAVEEVAGGVVTAEFASTAGTELQGARTSVSTFLDDEFRVRLPTQADVAQSVRTLYRGAISPSAPSRWWELVLSETRARLRDDRLRVRDVAATIPLSERQFSRLLSEHHTTWHELVLRERLRLLRDDLLSAEAQGRSIGEIVRGCGFSSPAHAYRRFREWTGMTPGAYRAVHASSAGMPTVQ
ncbi:helix-turn-helix domain-containing protein [Citricoccus sp. GCM10030269]|uniref:helix-turn-helix domain-containing protein n=1 Tax=Citricoccus sp. GCM10030269 TaxID=3273388 RepID=UPI00361DFC7A